jgi:phosphohistidine phosphatase
MRVYLLRHGKAVEWSPDTSDFARPLTAQGRDELVRLGPVLARMDLGIDRVITSPLIRAADTANLIAGALKLEHMVETDSRLGSGEVDVVDLRAVVGEREGCANPLIVGHNPWMSFLAGELLGGPPIAMKKAMLVCIELDRIAPAVGRLVFAAPCSMLLKAGG